MHFHLQIILSLLLSLFYSLVWSSSLPYKSGSPTVQVSQATYVGLNDLYYGVEDWLGVQYAKALVGPLRLQPPEPYQRKGIINSQYFGYRCFQVANLPANHSEDCLNLNIFTPSKTSKRQGSRHSNGLPVMIWIHGGGFDDGSGMDYDPRSIVNRSVELKSPVIVVTVNYRLAGTIAIANNALNLGLLDQRLAMKWVRENIAAFGGDPNKVTLFGQSAGATSIGLQRTACNGDCNNLFRATILESGSPSDTILTPPPTWPSYQTAWPAWDAVIDGIGCMFSSNVFSCMQNAPAALLFPVIQAVAAHSPLPSSIWPWQPVVDGKFVKDFPSKLTAAGNFAKVPIIMGFTTDEVTYVMPITLKLSSDAAILYLREAILPSVPASVFANIIALDPFFSYPSTGYGGLEWERTTQIASDLFESCPGREWIRNVTKFAPTWKSQLIIWNAIIPEQIVQTPWQNIVHSAELAYVFGPSLTEFASRPVELALSRQVQQAWISFASHLDPNALGTLSPNVLWPRYKERTEQVLVFQKPDGSGEQANGTLGTPLGQGLHTEKDPDDRLMCDYFSANDAVFVR